MQLFSAVIRLQWGYDSAAVRAWSKWIGYFSEVLSRVSCGCDRAVMQLWFECDVAVIRVWSVLEISGSAISQRLWSGSDAAVMWLWFGCDSGCSMAVLRLRPKPETSGSAISQRLWFGCPVAVLRRRCWCGCDSCVVWLWFGCDPSLKQVDRRFRRGCDPVLIYGSNLTVIRLCWNEWTGDCELLQQMDRRILKIRNKWICDFSELATN